MDRKMTRYFLFNFFTLSKKDVKNPDASASISYCFYQRRVFLLAKIINITSQLRENESLHYVDID